jgi:predicted helicase
LQVFLTNTLEPIEPQPNFLLPALSSEVEHAQRVKERAILVITGNPPYLGESLNKGKWITDLIKTYKKDADGNLLKERNLKWLQDDYVKFIRFAQWKMDSIPEGIVGVITNHKFLDNQTFRGMRASLMRTFSQIYVINLHGNSRYRELLSELDENVFDIQQGVSISILIRKKELPPKFAYISWTGKREDKYRACIETGWSSLRWEYLEPAAPSYFFIPKGTDTTPVYDTAFKLPDIFPVNSVGITTARDELTVQYSQEEVRKTVVDFANLPAEDARRKYRLGEDARDWKISLAQSDLIKDGLRPQAIVPITYRPFDARYTYYTGKSRGFMCMPRPKVMAHMLSSNVIPRNVAICCSRGQEIGGLWEHAFVAENIIQLHTVSAKEATYIFPLYLSSASYDVVHGGSLVARSKNLSPEFTKYLKEKYERKYTAEEVLGYIYSVLYSTAYRKRYADKLREDFPHVPFPDNEEKVNSLSKLGWDLVQAHLLRQIPDEPAIELTKGDDLIESPVYVASSQRLYINLQQYFAPVSDQVWNFTIGGYQVLYQYLKARKGREISLDEKENVRDTIKVLNFTITQMQQIDTYVIGTIDP